MPRLLGNGTSFLTTDRRSHRAAATRHDVCTAEKAAFVGNLRQDFDGAAQRAPVRISISTLPG
jgi:hypothetical protein